MLELKQSEVVKALNSLPDSKGNWTASAYSLLENGDRKVSIQELVELSLVLEFIPSEVISEAFDVIDASSPKFNFAKFKAVLLYILQQCREKQNVGKTVIYKLLYFTDFNYFEKYKRHLTGLSYSKLPMGPVPNATEFLDELERKGDIAFRKQPYFDREIHKYVGIGTPDITELSVEEKEVIDHSISYYANMSAYEISEFSHGDAPWIQTEDFQRINYNLVVNRNRKYKYVKSEE